MAIDDLPDGTCIIIPDDDKQAGMIRGNKLLHWSPTGYVAARPRPRSIQVEVLTPPSILAVLKAGYQPVWHPSAD